MDALERIRRGYRAIGPGAPLDVLAMFHQEEEAAPEWVVRDPADAWRTRASGETVAMDLFGPLPARFEFIGVKIRRASCRERV